jgi:AcrR family transcriptional regulator
MAKTSKEILPKNQMRRNSIIEAALSLFSEKGYENVRVDEIAGKAGVNKALIYYHFESKEAILNHLLDEFFAGIKALSLDYITNSIVKAIREGELDILPDRLRFANEEALAGFLEGIQPGVEKMLDYILDNRDTVRLMLAESLKRNNKKRGLFRFVELMEQKESNPLYRTIHDADSDFAYSTDIVVFKFFFSTLPMLNFAAYYDDYMKARPMEEKELRASFIRACMSVSPYPIEGRDLVIALGWPVSFMKE